MTLFDTLLEASHDDWQKYIQHPFVNQIGDGTLPAECFEHYLKQDYVFLLHFARCFGLAVFKSSTVEEVRHCLLYTSPSPRDATLSRMPSSA